MNYKALSAVLMVLVIILAGTTVYETTNIAVPGRASTATSTAQGTQTTQTPSKPLMSLRFSHPVRNESVELPFYVAEDLGLFAAEGLSIQDVVLPGDEGSTALLAGNVEITANGDPVLVPALKGANLTILYYTFIGPAYGWLAAKHEISSMAQLNGKLIASERPGSATYIWVSQILNYYHINATQVPFDSSALRVAAFLAGKVDALATSPNFLPKLGNANVLISAGGPVADYPSVFIATTPTVLKNNMQAMLSFLRAYIRAIAIVKTIPSVTIPVIMHHYNLTQTEARVFYDQMSSHYTIDNALGPIADRAAVLVQLNRISNAVPVSKAVDFSLYDQVIKKGM